MIVEKVLINSTFGPIEEVYTYEFKYKIFENIYYNITKINSFLCKFIGIKQTQVTLSILKIK